jgi:glycosidase
MCADSEMTAFTSRFRDNAPREFHVSRRAREIYGLDGTLFAVSGNVVFADFHAARLFAHSMNERRDLLHFPERAVSASQIHALGLIDEVLHLVIARHRRERAPELWSDALSSLEGELGGEAVDRVLEAFVDEFPPVAVFRGELTTEAYLESATDGVDHREIALEELVLLWLGNRNPAFAEFRELFDDERLRRDTRYLPAMEEIEAILGSAPASGRGGQSLLDLLYAPMRAAPHSLEGQLEFIRTTWADLLGPDLYRVLGGLDFLAEEQRAFFPAGPGLVEPPDYRVLAETGENYSADREWMSRLVLVAKNAHVWLAQLSAKYGREITTLDGIPDEELEVLASWGMTGLWLIGVWERSRASERIKKMMGDEDAVASAYSLEDYRIADALGGEAAYEDLRARSWAFGIRLSTDMVPNHMGIDSRWMIEHPDWFVSLDHSPYPSYTFDGPDVSDDERVGIFIEDHYWQKSDAAVVFKRLDRATGDERFVYHGNDGTSMPWNDTAQLDYLNPEVREAVIQTILAVARRSPVIRFDAAMTLARQHYHRLWFPEPGAAGAVPSRAEFGMSRAEFDAAMPREFWREVVDRVAAEAPDTLLLAEAFWLLEGYFVRTLGMHRVYNSAFMNMLRDERNADYRQLIRSTLEFDPQILKRFVNFMSNPDERTAIDQFGADDKYFGVATLMATMPGLPMFGHGQVEGLAEKYGMEFRRPRWEEEPNEGLVRRHELQLFPLLRRRSIFAEVDNFLLYDFVTGDGSVDENVFAYSNEVDGERSLIVYHNRFGDTHGRLQISTAVAKRDSDGNRRFARISLGDGLQLPVEDSSFLIYRDEVSGFEYLRSCRELRADGLHLDLDAYRLHCFLDFRIVTDGEDHPYERLAGRLCGRGVPSIEDALGQLVLSPVLEPLRSILAEPIVRGLAFPDSADEASAELRKVASTEVAVYLEAVARQAGSGAPRAEIERSILVDLEAALALPQLVASSELGETRVDGAAARLLGEALENPQGWLILLSWILVRRLGELSERDDVRELSRSRLEEWHVGSALADLTQSLGATRDDARRAVAAIDLMIVGGGRESGVGQDAAALVEIFASPAGQRFLGVHRYGDALWFNREAFMELVRWMMTTAAVAAIADGKEEVRLRIDEIQRAVDWIVSAGEDSGYQMEEFLESVRLVGDERAIEE